ncbi:MAG: hypothetical protein WCA56_18225 [Xanthobacteraceae bacterium]
MTVIRRASPLVDLIETIIDWPSQSYFLGGKSEYAYEPIDVPAEYPCCDNRNRDVSPSSKLSMVRGVRRRQFEWRLRQQ